MHALRFAATALLALVVSVAAQAAPAPGSLAEAAHKGDLRQVKSLLADGASPEDRGTGNATALMLAAESGHPDVMKALLAAGADPKATRTGAITALHHAAAGGNLEAIGLLLAAHADINAATTATGQTPVLSALLSKRWAAARTLLAAGANLNATPLGEHALLLALNDNYLRQSSFAEEDLPGIDVAFIQTLIKLGARIDLKDTNGNGLVHLAAHARQPDIVAFLLKAGLKPDEPNAAGKTPLLLAAETSQMENLIIGYTALPSLFGAMNPSTSFIGVDSRALLKGLKAAGYPSPGMGPLAPRFAELHDRRKRTLAILLAAGAKPNVKDGDNDTALSEAAYCDDADAAETLLLGKADPNALGLRGYSPMMLAAAQGYDDFVAQMLAHGAQVDLRTAKGETALMRASTGGGDSATVRVLLAAHADVNARNNDGQTALIYAAGENKEPFSSEKSANPEIERVVKALLAAGADATIADNSGKTALDYSDSPKYSGAHALIEDAMHR